ncbi:hypothetical protein FO441_05495 [Salinicoccus cyprini]|uniref:EMYY motif lipoprotein n=1 Tax=Salinicoccus cyprini TaxID=2493691 RepID=A0A558AZS1_9STAP|nr:hypothetical protein [Salinicoccus cyprini]TVT29734.1 hypothetical protein FO441_05495 [Salinicoccus cyprini]
MKKLIPILIFLLLAGCAQGDRQALDDLYEAFERNHEELETEFTELFNEMEESEDREAKLRMIYEEALPRIEDLRRTIHNYTVTGTEHEQLKEEMLTYTNSLENLVELYGEFNRTFINYNPLGDSDFREKVDDQLAEIESQEELVQERYQGIQEDYEQLTSEKGS